MKLTVREKNLVIFAVTVVICSLMATYLILPLKDRYSQNRNNYNESSARLEQLSTAGKQVKGSGENLNQLSVQLAVYRKQLPQEVETAELLYFLHTAALKSGVILEKFESSESQEMSKDEAKESKKIVNIPFRIRIMGNYHQVRTFLKETEHLKRIVHNQSITINENQTLKTLECLIQFEAFVKPSGVNTPVNLSDIPPAAKGRAGLFIY